MPSTDDETESLWQRCWYHRVCQNLVVPGEDVCTTCRTAWGALLALATPAPAVCTDTGDDIPSSDGPAAAAAVAAPEPAVPVEKRGQRCWLCEQRRTCVLVAGHWECRTCRTVTG